ncbi:hypothetical protein K2X85_11710 [bacterium]|nr:hypothetical protein [bacterium]
MLFACGAILASLCSLAGDESDDLDKSASNPSQNVSWEDLQLRWQQDEIVAYRISDRQRIQDLAPGSPLIESQTICTLSLKPIEKTEQIVRLRAQYDRVKGSLTQGKAKTVFDTLDEPSRKDASPTDMYREWIGRDWEVDLDRQGMLMDLRPGARTKESASMTAAAAQLRRHVVLLWSWLPKSPIDQQLRWSRQEKLAAGLVDLVRENRLHVIDRDGPRLLIEGELRISGQPTRQPGPEGETVIASIDAPKPGQAKIVFHADQGHVVRIESEIDFVMNVTRVMAKEADPTNPGTGKSAVQSSQKLEARTIVEFLSRSAFPSAN